MIVLRVAHAGYVHRITGLPCGPYSYGQAQPVAGPWPGGETTSPPGISCWGPGRLPMPENDGIGTIDGTTLTCAFRDLDQLRQWFGQNGRSWAEAEARGWRIFEYDVPDEHVFHGECQVVFDPDYASVGVAHLPLTFGVAG